MISLMWNLKEQNKTKTNLQIQRTDQWLPEGKEVVAQGKMDEGGQLYGDHFLVYNASKYSAIHLKLT